ncbi:hypothetical protein TBLA_0C01650 [Henningerozyma blattae CBS 6284]|uniref:Nucleolar 27S pre-rRNA processing Urb2/Npa2 C-terminal domain-containing protein n=1 Tax=Henningerozyma blattae (strain ATCC 34711 / CBS 6284 / DSM 70876 / NBRC 10599 / NRRL Y-10934 / UCD 77-7) TaxID=1071380 RepID=I2H0S7_HENB6|nr:hypothetical protein TBLA_0C01650 [Tetrapisispora blattae CBS 6284]CCH59979.1 hypothetical protein TBLA_0C01650 [Tetrapisispora blattae CBS 6284]
MLLPENTQSLTKLLRSKDITTCEIYDIVINFDNLKFNFPNKEIFVLELIIDRWNDAKLTKFKTDPKIWQLFNTIWSQLDDENIKRRLFKNLKFFPHLAQALNLVSSFENPSDVEGFLISVSEICKSFNYSLTLGISLENAERILADLLTLINRTNMEKFSIPLRQNIVQQILNLTDFGNRIQLSNKNSASYTNILLLPSLEYISCNPEDDFTNSTLTSFMAKLLFGPHINPIKQLETFFKNKGSKLNASTSIILFEKSASFLSKQKIEQLEIIFTLVTDAQPTVTSQLLNKLSSSKKTLSQPFLEKLFTTCIDSNQNKIITTQETWSLILDILELDLEIGIKYFETLLKLIDENKDANKDNTIKIWSKIIKCHINAREFYKFFDELQSFIIKSNYYFLLSDSSFSYWITSNLSFLSSSQLNDLLSKCIDNTLHDSSNNAPLLLLETCCNGLINLSYTALPFFKTTLSKIFNSEDAKNQSKLYAVKYILMEVYEDFVTGQNLEDLTREITIPSDLKGKNIIDFTYFCFKLREYRDFDISNVISYFVKTFKKPDVFTSSTKLSIIEELFTKWSSIINLLFSKEDLTYFVEQLLAEPELTVLQKLVLDDDFFEEGNILYLLTNALLNLLDNVTIVSLLIDFPIQCIHKDLRIELINKIIEKSAITKNDSRLLFHLLEYPTFKSIIETDLRSLYHYLSKSTDTSFEYSNIVVEKIWNNHVSQSREDVSKKFITNTILELTKRMQKKSLDITYSQLAFFIINSTTNRTTLKELTTEFLSAVTRYIEKKQKLDESLYSEEIIWYLKSLYYIWKSNDDIISSDFSLKSFIPNILEKVTANLENIESSLLISLFSLFCITNEANLPFLFAHYMTLRSLNINSNLLSPSLNFALENSLKSNKFHKFNKGFATTISSLTEPLSSDYKKSIIEIYVFQLHQLRKENEVGVLIFRNSLSQLYTNIDNFLQEKPSIILLLNSIKDLLVSKSWLFSQYSVELLFPLTLRLNVSYISNKSELHEDEIFQACTSVIANVLFIHRINLSNRNHLVIGWLSECLTLMSSGKLNEESAKLLSRTIVNYCEPPASHSGNKSASSSQRNRLTSTTNIIKKSLRKDVPVLLVKYVFLSLYSPIDQKY